jgi:hypothetical protein
MARCAYCFCSALFDRGRNLHLTTLQLWWLCGGVAAALAAQSTAPQGFAAILLGGAVGGLSGAYLAPSLSTLALLLGAFAARSLLRPVPVWQSLATAGCAAGYGAWLLQSQGLHWFGAAPVALSVPLLAWSCARSPAFAPPRLREQALCGLTIAAPCVAAQPLIGAGWQSAGTLNRAAVVAGSAPAPAWVWQLVAVATACGILHALWVRR